MAPTFIGAYNGVEEDHDIDQDPREYVEAVEAGDKEKEIREHRGPVFIVDQVRALHHLGGLPDLVQGLSPVQECLFPFPIEHLGAYKDVRTGLEAFQNLVQ